MESKIKIGVIGLGRMGQIYSRSLVSSVPQAQVVCVCDEIGEKAESLAAELGVGRWTKSYHDLLDDKSIEAVVVTAPTGSHREVVTAASNAGKAIFCEKPIALTLEDTDAMSAVIEKNKTMFQAGFMRRFDAGYAAAKKKIEEGFIGQPTTFKSIGRDPFCPDLNYAKPSVSGGLILDMAIHDFDLARWLMNDDVKRVYTEGGTLAFPQLNTVDDFDNAVTNLLFRRGYVGNVEVSRNAVYGYDIRTEVLGTEGGINIGYYQQTPILMMNRQGVQHDMVPYIIQRFGHAYAAQIKDFVERVSQGKEPAVGVKDARAALEIGIAATTSYHEARPVELPL